jgi:putative heme iron utilization protein
VESALSSDAATAICAHMNEDHANALEAYARTYGRIERVQTAAIIALDPQAMELAVETEAGRIVTRIAFDHVLADKDDARDTLIRMARAAQQAG